MIDIRAVNRSQFAGAKRYWAAAVGGKLILFAVGIWAAFSEVLPRTVPVWALLIAVVSELFQMRSDGLKARAETLLRLLDMCRSFGREISEADKRDIIVAVPQRLRRKFHIGQDSDQYFASREPAGPKRALENLYESAWYNGRLAGAMSAVYVSSIGVLVTVSIAALIVALRADASPENEVRVIRAVTAWLMLLVSLNMLKAAWSYFKMYQRCEKTKAACARMFETSTESDALRQWHEYQVARNASPLIPDWLWRQMEKSLNDAWELARGDGPSSAA